MAEEGERARIRGGEGEERGRRGRGKREGEGRERGRGKRGRRGRITQCVVRNAEGMSEGMSIKSHVMFNCDISEKVKSFYLSANGILMIEGRSNETVIMQLLEAQFSHPHLRHRCNSRRQQR